jgi:hypothetical protein
MKQIIVKACLDCPYHRTCSIKTDTCGTSVIVGEFHLSGITLHTCSINHKAIHVVLPVSVLSKDAGRSENIAEIFNPELLTTYYGDYIPEWCPLKETPL